MFFRCPHSTHMQSSISADLTSWRWTTTTPSNLTLPSGKSWEQRYCYPQCTVAHGSRERDLYNVWLIILSDAAKLWRQWRSIEIEKPFSSIELLLQSSKNLHMAIWKQPYQFPDVNHMWHKMRRLTIIATFCVRHQSPFLFSSVCLLLVFAIRSCDEVPVHFWASCRHCGF